MCGGADRFTGNPGRANCSPPSRLADGPEEDAFLNGPVDALCGKLDAWKINGNGANCAGSGDFIKRENFFGMIIPKE